MATRRSHLRLLPPPSLTNMGIDHPVFGVAAVGEILRRIQCAEKAGDETAASAARADMRAAMAAAREAATRPLNLDPYRKSTPTGSPNPLLIVIEPDPAIFVAFVADEGLARARVKRCSTFRAAIRAEAQAKIEGRPTTTIEGRAN